ncbi:unnamed protein product [Rhodiola kirilowii]
MTWICVYAALQWLGTIGPKDITQRAGLIDSVMDVACKWRTLMHCKVQVDQLDFVSR